MSYILDALNRADAERERGSVPGLHARQTYVQPSRGSNVHSRLWIALAATLTIAGIALGVWLWRTPVATIPPAVAAVATAPAPTAPAAPAHTSETPASPAPVAAPPVQTPVAKPSKHPVAQTKAPKATPKPTAIEKELVTANATATIPLLSELSSGVRSQIPPLNITGAVYSNNPGQRLLLVNNLVLNQGSLAAPEVTLEEIRPNTSVFSFRGTKFRMEH